MISEKRKPGKIILVVLLFLLIFAIAAYINIMPEDNSSASWQNIFLSIIASLIASGLFYLMQSAVDTDNVKDVESILHEINRKLEQQENLYKSGVVSIRSKKYYDKNGEFWKQMIKKTSDKLDLVGHDISPWFSNEYRTVFIEKIISMINNKKNVQIILSGDAPIMENIYAVETGEKKEKELSKIEMTCYELRKVIRAIGSNKEKDQTRNLNVYIADLKRISYMYIRTDSRCYMSPYVTSDNSFLLEMEVGFEYSRWLDEDFENILKTAEKIDLEMNNERATKNRSRKLLFWK